MIIKCIFWTTKWFSCVCEGWCCWCCNNTATSFFLKWCNFVTLGRVKHHKDSIANVLHRCIKLAEVSKLHSYCLNANELPRRWSKLRWPTPFYRFCAFDLANLFNMTYENIAYHFKNILHSQFWDVHCMSLHSRDEVIVLSAQGSAAVIDTSYFQQQHHSPGELVTFCSLTVNIFMVAIFHVVLWFSRCLVVALVAVFVRHTTSHLNLLVSSEMPLLCPNPTFSILRCWVVEG